MTKMQNNSELINDNFIDLFTKKVDSYTEKVNKFKLFFNEIENDRKDILKDLEKIEKSEILDKETKNKLLKMKI